MKVSSILVLLILSATVNATFLLQPLITPVMFTLGALFTANEIDVDPLLDGMRDLLSLNKSNVNKMSEEKEEEESVEDMLGSVSNEDFTPKDDVEKEQIKLDKDEKKVRESEGYIKGLAEVNAASEATRKELEKSHPE